MFVPRLAAVCFAVLVLASGASASPMQVSAPTGLHAFLFRADDPSATSFPRTPAFAWNPVPGALRYQFQLANSAPFRENAIVYSAKLKSPVAAPTTTLPWITSMMHARVRAILADDVTPWSAQFNFDMTPPDAPQALKGFPGMLRWTPVEGADAYEVWLIDVPQMVTVFTNVLDEREFYTLHRTLSWMGSVRWRIRALRYDRDGDQRQNGLPAAPSYTQWSNVYSSTNPLYTRAGEPIRLTGTVSDVYSGDEGTPAHKLMPGFLFSGDQTLDGRSAELFRVYVSTDQGCLNTVFTSPIIGSPAYAPRPFNGPIGLPTTLDGVAGARNGYLTGGAEPSGFTLDNSPIRPNETLPSSTPTVAVPSDSDTDPGGLLGTNSGGPAQLKLLTNFGAPVDLWDTEGEASRGYWWTVVAVGSSSPGAISTNVSSAAPIGAQALPVLNGSGFGTGDVITIGSPANEETVTVTSASGSSLGLGVPLKQNHGAGETVVRSSAGSLNYRDLELASDVCRAGRVARFAKNSEPVLTTSGELFATGLSSKGRLISARAGSTFYGSPLVAWTPALGATSYEVQWSKKLYPFKPEPNPENANAPGTMTLGTAAVLPLSAGSWYYRVRGFDYSLPTNAQQMSWSDPAKIVVVKPKFKIVGGGK
jgi:hypothetical protein